MTDIKETLIKAGPYYMPMSGLQVGHHVEPYMCWALNTAILKGAITPDEASKARDAIYDVIGGAITVKQYLTTRRLAALNTQPVTLGDIYAFWYSLFGVSFRNVNGDDRPDNYSPDKGVDHAESNP